MYSSLSIKPQDASDPKFTFAFQPIVDTNAREVLSYEALIRGPADEPAYQVLQQISADKLLAFDQRVRVEAIDLAMRLQLNRHLNLNFLPRCVESSPQSILTTLEAAGRVNLPIERLVLEVVEGEIIYDHSRFTSLINKYRAMGLMVAIDDFGAGYSGLNLLADFQPDQVKLDMKLIRGIERNGPRQSIVRAIDGICFDLGIDVIAEGVETERGVCLADEPGDTPVSGISVRKACFRVLPASPLP